MKHTSTATRPGTGTDGSRARTVGTATMVAGGMFVLVPPVSALWDRAWIGLLVGFALLVYVVPRLHRIQAPADGWAGRLGSPLVAAGAGIMVGLGAIFLVWEAIGEPGEPGWAGLLWMVGFLAFLLGVIAFALGTAVARRFPVGAPAVMLLGLVSAVAIDMATGAFFDDRGGATEWGFYLGIPLFGLGLVWLGHAVSRELAPTAPGLDRTAG